MSASIPQTDSPFLIHCSHCGAPADFDIRDHIYKCSHCGASTDASAPLEDLTKWRQTAKNSRDASLLNHPAVICTCPSCGAAMAVNEGEMSGTCPFCGGTMARRSAGDRDPIPEVVIPFVLTKEDAQARLDRWLQLHPHDRCASAVRKNRGKLEAVFLPYRLVKGPMTCSVKRIGANRVFTCGAFVNGSAVNASTDMPNDVLDAMEPYDWNEARAFDWGYLSGGQKARFPDITEEELQKRTAMELSEACRPMVEKALMTVGVQVEAQMNEALDMPALLPVYALRGDFGFRAFVNGQTGRVAVSDDTNDTRVNRWWLPPLIISALAFWLIFSFDAAAHFFALHPDSSFGQTMLKAMSTGFLSGDTPAIVFRQTLLWFFPFLLLPVIFFIFRRNKALTWQHHILSTPRCRAIRTSDSGSRLKFEEGKNVIIQDTAEVRPVFFERERSAPCGASTVGRNANAADFWSKQGLFPVQIRFFPVRRIIRWTIQTVLTAFLPAIINGIGALLGAKIFMPTLVAMSGLWLLLVASWPLMSSMRRIGIHVFENPAIQRIHPDGSRSWIEKGQEESIFLGVKQIFTPFFKLISKAFSWATSTPLGSTLGIGVFGFCLLPLILMLLIFPAFFLITPMSDNTGSKLSQASSKGSSMRLLESIFASSSDLTQQEWNALPQIDLPELLSKSAHPLYMLSDKSIYEDRREKIKIRIKRTLGESNKLNLSDSSPNYLKVKIPQTNDRVLFIAENEDAYNSYGSKMFLATSEPTYKTFNISIIDLDTVIPEDKLPLVTEYLNNFQRALPWGGFSSAAGTSGRRDHFVFVMGLNVRGMKRVPQSWGELMTFWPLDVMETAEKRVRALIAGKTADVNPDEKDVKELTDDFWMLTLWDGKEDLMKENKSPGRFDDVPDLTPEKAIALFDAYFAENDLTAAVEQTTSLSRKLNYNLKTDMGMARTTVTIDASRPNTVLVRAALKLKTNEAGEKRLLQRFFNEGNNSIGFRRISFDPKEKMVVAERRIFLRMLKNPPEDLAKVAFIQSLASLKAGAETATK